MIRPAVFLNGAELAVLICELFGSGEGQEYEPVCRDLGFVEPLRVKIQTAIMNGERIIICPDRIGPQTTADIIKDGPFAAVRKSCKKRPGKP